MKGNSEVIIFPKLHYLTNMKLREGGIDGSLYMDSLSVNQRAGHKSRLTNLCVTAILSKLLRAQAFTASHANALKFTSK